MSNGYILLWRKSLDSLVWTDAKFWRLWSWCLLRASWKERTVLLGRTPVRLQPGDLATTLAEAAAHTGLSQKEVRSCLALGQKTGCLRVRGTARGTQVSIVRWQEYQRPGADPAFAADTPMGTPTDRPMDRPRGRPRGGLPAQSGQAPGTPSHKENKENQGRNAQNQGAGQAACEAGAEDCERFLAAYPKRTAQAAARAAWRQLAGELPDGLPPLAELLAAVASQTRLPAWTREAGRYIPSPANWLLGRRWQDAGAQKPGVDLWLRGQDQDSQGAGNPARTGATQPGAARTGASQIIAARTDASQPDASQPGAGQGGA